MVFQNNFESYKLVGARKEALLNPTENTMEERCWLPVWVVVTITTKKNGQNGSGDRHYHGQNRSIYHLIIVVNIFYLLIKKISDVCFVYI